MKQAEVLKKNGEVCPMTKAKEILTEARRNLKKKMTVKSRADRSITSKASGIKIPRTVRRRRNGNLSGSVAPAEVPIAPVNGGIAET
jgi:ABC-type dipeptide/oligopeptide/nickel transport system ATPase subunit